MSKFQIAGAGWPVGQFLIPNGVVIMTDVPPDQMDQWSAEVWRRGLPPPLNAQALDESTYQEMVALYEYWRVAPVRTG